MSGNHPGPWSVLSIGDSPNQRLYASAPYLLDALKAIQALAHPSATHIHAIIKAAIEKAEGK